MFSKNFVNITQNNNVRTFLFPPSEGDFNCNSTFNFNSVEDGDPIIKTYDNFIINQQGTVSVSKRCKGLYLNILGDCIIDGTLSMSGRGAKGKGTNIGIDTRYGIFYSDDKNYLLNNLNILEENIIPAVGASYNTSGINRQTGGGGRGMVDNYRSNWFCWNIIFRWLWWRPDLETGGAGYGVSRYPTAGEIYAGAGGAGIVANWGINRGGGGAGNPGGDGGREGQVQTGTGGVIILIVHGSLRFSQIGLIVSNGYNGASSIEWKNATGGRFWWAVLLIFLEILLNLNILIIFVVLAV